MAEELIKALQGPLEAEVRSGYRNTAVIGQSLADYARAWAARAGAAGLPPAAELAGQIANLLAGYGSATPAERRRQVAKAKRLLGELLRSLPRREEGPRPRVREVGAGGGAAAGAGCPAGSRVGEAAGKAGDRDHPGSTLSPPS